LPVGKKKLRIRPKPKQRVSKYYHDGTFIISLLPAKKVSPV
jgi:hypothetical protein